MDYLYMKDGYKMTDIGLIPMDWKVAPIKNYITKISRRNRDDSICDVVSVTKHDGIVDSKTYFNNQVFSNDLTTYKIIRKGEFAYPPIHINEGSIGYLQHLQQAVLSPMYTVFSINTLLINHYYLFSILKSHFYIQLYCTFIKGSVERRGAVSFEEFSNIEVPLPPLPEQQKIADILSTVDEHISETESLIEKTKVLKQGMMQHLLTKGIGHTEFKDTEIGRIPVEWEVIPVGKYIKNVSRKNRDGLVTDVVSVTKHNGIVDSMSYFKNQVYSDNLTTYKIVRRDEFAFPPIHLNEGSIGYLEHIEQAVLSPMYTVFSVNKCFLDNYFLFGLLKSHKYIDIYSTFIEGTVERRGAVSFDKFSGIKIPLPPLPEQKKITSILTSIDDQNDSYNTKLTSLTKLKSALMQQLLTGRTRVKI